MRYMHSYNYRPIICSGKDMKISQMPINRRMDKKDVVYTYNGMRKKEILPFVTTWMDLEPITLSELSQRKVLYDIAYMWNLKKLNL